MEFNRAGKDRYHMCMMKIDNCTWRSWPADARAAWVLAFITALVVLIFCGCASNRGETVEDMTVKFDATVMDVKPIGSFEGKLTVVARDPKFALSLKLREDIEPLDATRGAVVHFGIHSPTKLFADVDVIGKGFSFSLTRRETNEGPSYRLYCESPPLPG
jgi:hypothetical protein